MPRLRTLVPSLLLAVVLLVPSSANASSNSRMMSKINSFRGSHGVHSVHQSRSLVRSARRYARRMMRRGYFGHAGRIQTSPRFRTAGEILAMHNGGGAHVAATMNGWINSPSHAAIMLDRRFDWAGAAKVTGRWRGQRWTFWVVHFGAR
jgi:uncharacterized protein YkwD